MTVQFYAHDEPNAPVLTGENSAAINVIEACAITGFGARSPIGNWAAAYTGTDKRAWYSTHADSVGCKFQCVDDGNSAGGARGAMLRGYENMTSVDAGTNPFPTIAQQAQSGYGIWKSQTDDTTQRPWWVVGDELFLYLITAPRSRDFVDIIYFGQIADSRKPGDAWPCIIGANKYLAAYTDYEGTNTAIGSGTGYNTADGPAYLARAHNQSISAVPADHWTWNSAHPGQAGFLYPHPAEGGLLMSAPRIVEPGPVLRGTLPGLYVPWHERPVPHLAILDDVDALPGRQSLALRTFGPNNIEGQVLIDITGPWR